MFVGRIAAIFGFSNNFNMRAPLSWLKEFVSISLPPAKLAERLTLSGTEVEDIVMATPFDEHFLVGKVRSVRPHPNADKLRLVDVDLGRQQKEIVCGAPNVAAGQTVAVVLVGGTLPSGIKIEARPIRGIVSEGMICAADELGRGSSHDGILELPAKWAAGTPLADVFPGDETVFNIALTPQRSDLFSLLGLAREIAALTHGKLRAIPSPRFAADRQALSAVKVRIEAPKLCPRYAIRKITGVTVKPSPLWMQKRLMAAGIRPINTVVDVTNYVMMELGQPLHAFDANQLNDGQILVRHAKAGESLTTLDGVQRRLTADMLVIADAHKPIAIAGVMGGANSGIREQTTDIILEAAIFDPISVRKTSSALHLRSDAAQRFEKGVDTAMLIPALDRAAALIAEHAEGRVVSGMVDLGKSVPPIRVATSLGFISERLGVQVTAVQVRKILQALGLGPKIVGQKITVTVPSWRHDIAIPEDVVDEVGRMIGFGTMPHTLPEATAAPRPAPSMYTAEAKVRETLPRAGWLETLSYPFYGAGLMSEWGLPVDGHVRLANALSPEQEYLRQSLLPQLFAALKKNRQVTTEAALFEIGHVFLLPWSKDGLPREESHLAVVTMTNDNATNAYRQVKGAAEFVLQRFGITDATWKREGDTVQVMIGAITCGTAVVHDHEKYRLAGIELSLPALLRAERPTDFRPISAYPAVERDIAAWVPQGFSFQKFAADVRHDLGLVTNIDVFDIFTRDGRASMAFRLHFQPPDRTLTKEEIDSQMERISAILQSAGATIR